jgi:glycosyltransferase 2 family protein
LAGEGLSSAGRISCACAHPDMANIQKKRLIAVVLGLLISTGSILTLIAIVSPNEFKSAFSEFNPQYIVPFALTVFLMIVCFGYRWHILLRGAISTPLAIRAMLINMGGNMVLPARGGDLLRIHFSNLEGNMSVAVVVGALLTEKAADLLAICLIGALGGVLFGLGDATHQAMIAAATAVFLFVLISVVFVRMQNGLAQRICLWVFIKLRLEKFFREYVSPLITSLGENLELRTFAKTMSITLVLWLVIYGASYLFIARLVGVSLSYPEALVVLWASGLGLMIPAAPSGLGVYHTTVVSAFYFLDRPIAEGLVLATALHISFFVALVVPMCLFYGKWLFKRDTAQ